MSYASARAFIRGVEGGAYHPTHTSYDPNPTKWGITQATYSAAGYPGSVYDMTEDQWDAIFTARFWRKAGCHLWPEPLDLVLADPAFNSGPKQALKWFQRVLGAQSDGILGPKTIGLALSATQTPKEVFGACIRVQGQRIRFLRDLFDRSVRTRKAWDALPPEQRVGERPALAPISAWMDRVDRLGRVAGLH